MKYYELTYPNHTTLIMKSDRPIREVLTALSTSHGVVAPSGTIYNPKTFLTLDIVFYPDSKQKHVAQDLDNALIGAT